MLEGILHALIIHVTQGSFRRPRCLTAWRGVHVLGAQLSREMIRGGEHGAQDNANQRTSRHKPKRMDSQRDEKNDAAMLMRVE